MFLRLKLVCSCLSDESENRLSGGGASMADNRSGQQLGNYRLIRLLGQGGFADVYLGDHIYLKTQAAIKILQIRLAGDDMQGFLNEALP